MTTGLYVSKGFAESDGVPIITSTKMTLKQVTNGSDVDTILDDGTGFAKGVTKYEVDLENPVPADGFEVDYFALAAAGRVHLLRFVFLNPDTGGEAFSKLLRGVWRDPNTGTAANSAATTAVTFHGREVVATGA